MGYNLPYVFYLRISTFEAVLNINSQSNITYCSIDNSHIARIITVLHTINTVTLPFSFMLTSTLLVTYAIYKSKKRVLAYHLSFDNRRLLTPRDIKFSITSIALNLIFLTFNLPISIAYLTNSGSIEPFSIDRLYFSVIRDLYYCNFSSPFIIYIFSNQIFYREFRETFITKTFYHISKFYNYIINKIYD